MYHDTQRLGDARPGVVPTIGPLEKKKRCVNQATADTGLLSRVRIGLACQPS